MLTRYRAVFDPPLRVVARGLAALRVSPTGVTWASLVLQTAGAVLIAQGLLFRGTVVWAIGAILDSLDGTIARLTGRVTRAGGYLDSLLDRYGDATILLAIGWHYDTAWIWTVCLLALLGSMATSYAKARAYQDVDVPSSSWPDLLERPERAFLIGFATGFQGMSDAGVWPEPLRAQFLPFVVVALAVLSHVTVVQRARRALRFIAAEGP